MLLWRLNFYVLVAFADSDVEGSSLGRGDFVASIAVARGTGSQIDGRALHLSPARAAGFTKGGEDRAGGDGPRRSAGSLDAGFATTRNLAEKRTLRDSTRCIFQ